MLWWNPCFHSFENKNLSNLLRTKISSIIDHVKDSFLRGGSIFLWKSKAPSKVKALIWLVANGKVNTNDMLQLRRPYKSLSLHWCILCKGNGKSIDLLFLHCPLTLGLWHKFFSLARMDWFRLGALTIWWLFLLEDWEFN